MEYTKGEWKAKGSRVVIPNKEGFIPTPQWPVFVVAQTSTYCNPDGEEAEANARLIAKAPELYEALKALLNTSICDICYEDECGGESNCTKGPYGEPCECHSRVTEAESLAHEVLKLN